MSLHPRLCQTAAKKKVNSTLRSMAWLPRQRCAAHHKLINSPKKTTKKKKRNCSLSFLFVRAVCSGRLPVVYANPNHLVGLVVRRPPRDRKIPGSNPACAGIFSESSHTSDSKIGTPVATLPGAWRYRVSSGTGRPGVSIL